MARNYGTGAYGAGNYNAMTAGTMTASAGTVTQTGRPVALIWLRQVFGGTGLSTLAGGQAGLAAGRRASVGNGLLGLIGQAVAPAWQASLDAARGIGVASGQALGMPAWFAVSAGEGAMSFSSTESTFDLGSLWAGPPADTGSWDGAPAMASAWRRIEDVPVLWITSQASEQ